MYDYIKGTVTDINANNITLEAGQIGYEITVSANCLSELCIGKDAKFYTFLSVREDGMSLYGFSGKVEKSMFLRLTTVSGIGPKAAINILSGISLNDLASAVAMGDIAKLSSVKGIGKKTAERIIVELKDKFSAEINVKLPNSGIMTEIIQQNDEVLLALVSLGLTKAEAVKAIAKIDCTNLTTEQIIFKALKG